MKTVTSLQQEPYLETFGSIYDLTTPCPSTLTPFAHQTEALNKLEAWYTKNQGLAGGILALPTGGGKTLTAWRFLCEKPLSDGYKVLWLAHTHHLLEQAFHSLPTEVGLIRNRRKLQVRVVSGTVGHFKPAHIEENDDVLISTLQTISRAYSKGHQCLQAFINSANGKLIVIFDEAHHAPAPSYRKLIQNLQTQCPNMKLLGLTATPTYTDEDKRGWLKELFPQGILYQVSVKNLIGQNILAQPVFDDVQTKVEPDFSEEDYRKWVRDYRDISEKIITKLAENSNRNALIAKTYVENKDKYGKTIIFSDRWFQCEALRQELRKHGVRADAVFAHVDAKIGSVDQQNRRTADENKQIIEKFKNNELDVLINVRILTEGTDIPDVKTVFLTRQTTSKILLTQMVGRALRGSKACPGKEKAYIVSFIDDWKQEISWADFDIEDGDTSESETRKRERTAIELISIRLLRRLCDQMYAGININPAEFLTFLPVGWYVVQYETTVEDTDETEIVQSLIMIYEHEQEAYEKFIEYIRSYPHIERFSEPDIKFEDNQLLLEEWHSDFFENIETVGGDRLADLFHIARDVATIDDHEPSFFNFEQRKEHDLDTVAQKYINKPGEEEYSLLEEEYERNDRFWKSFYHTYDSFWSHYTACKSWLLKQKKKGWEGKGINSIEIPAKQIGPSEEHKKKVKERDSNRCLCCGSTSNLEVDHINPKYHSGDHSIENLQTLCRVCNQFKSDKYVIDFRSHQPKLMTSPHALPDITAPVSSESIEQWKEYLRRVINFFYECSAVESLRIASGSSLYWDITLYSDHDPNWISLYLEELLPRILENRHGQILIPKKLSIR